MEEKPIGRQMKRFALPNYPFLIAQNHKRTLNAVNLRYMPTTLVQSIVILSGARNG